MTPYESCSLKPRRMLFVVKAGQAVQAIFDKWNVPLAAIGRVTDDGFLRLKHGEEVLAEVPAGLADAQSPSCSQRPDWLVKPRT